MRFALHPARESLFHFELDSRETAPCDQSALRRTASARSGAVAHGYYEPEELREQLKGLGYHPDEILPAVAHKRLYAENALSEAQQALKSLLVKESLEFGIASSEAAFVATRIEKGRKVGQTAIVPNALPAGWSETFLAGGTALACSVAAPSQGFGGMAMRAMRASSPSFASVGDAFQGIGAMFDPTDALLSSRASAASRRTLPAAVHEEAGPPLFVGAPIFTDGEAVLFEVDPPPREPPNQPETTVFSEMRLQFPSGTPDANGLGSKLAILIYIDDLATPRARILLADLARQGWRRPLNIARREGEALRIVLADPEGVWAAGAPEMEVYLA